MSRKRNATRIGSGRFEDAMSRRPVRVKATAEPVKPLLILKGVPSTQSAPVSQLPAVNDQSEQTITTTNNISEPNDGKQPNVKRE